MKTCIKCEKPKILDDFYNHPDGKHGKASVCKVCACARTSRSRQRKCLVPGCMKKQNKRMLCVAHWRRWVAGEMDHPKYGDHEEHLAQGLLDPEYGVPDGRSPGTCKGCAKNRRINYWGYCKECWTRKDDGQLIEDKWLYE